MKWPFVSRAEYDREVRAAVHALAEANRLARETERSLQRELDDLRREMAGQQLAAERTNEKSRLTTAIRDLARQPDGSIDRRLLSHFRGQANQLRREGKDTDAIIEALGEWQTTERVDALSADAIVARFTDDSL